MTFSIARYAESAAPVQTGDLDMSDFAERPLSPDTLRVLRYMCDVESHTVCYLRDMLLTPGHKDPQVTAFLTMWNYEEYWHGEVLADVLTAHGIATGDAHVRSVRLRQGWKDKTDPLVQAMAANLIGEAFVATHMTWGAVNEWLTHTGYTRLAAIEDHPVLTELLSRIARQETRHIAFYTTQARHRLGNSALARRITRWALAHRWRPVGATIMPTAEVRHLIRHLLGGPDGLAAARRIDAKIDTLPGLAGLGLVQRRVQQLLL